MHVGLKHPEIFQIVASLSGSLIFFDGAKTFASRLRAAKMPHIFRPFPGPHIMPVARQELAGSLPLLLRP